MGITADRFRDLFQGQAALRSRDLEAAGFARAQLSRMVNQGTLIRVARGLYALPDHASSSDEGFLIAAVRAPQAVFCLLTALQYHGITTQTPFEIWLGIGNKDRAPRFGWPPLRVVRFSGNALEVGIESGCLAGVPFKVTSAARTVVDCFKFRNKIGIDVAVEALRDAHRSRRVSMDELWQLATIFRVANVMRPYLTTLA